MKFEPLVTTSNIRKDLLYISFLITIAIYAIFFDRSLKLEYKEICPCNPHYTLYQYIDRGTIWNRNDEFINMHKTFKLENQYGITKDKLG